MSDAAVTEQLARIEHKIDFVLKYLERMMGPNWIPQMGEGSHDCPVCKKPVKYVLDIPNSCVLRQCGCKTGKIALDMGQFVPPPAVVGGKYGDERDADSEREQSGSGAVPGRGVRGSSGPRHR